VDTLLWAADGFGNLINILRLDNCLQIIFKKLGKVVCIKSAIEVVINRMAFPAMAYSEAQSLGSV
jgi:hypothetical protein